MIKQDDYEGMAYYFYELDGQAEFGKVWIFPKYNKGYKLGSFPVYVHFFFGYESNLDGIQHNLSSNQLHGQTGVKTNLENFYLSLDELADKRRTIIKTIFDATQSYARG